MSAGFVFKGLVFFTMVGCVCRICNQGLGVLYLLLAVSAGFVFMGLVLFTITGCLFRICFSSLALFTMVGGVYRICCLQGLVLYYGWLCLQDLYSRGRCSLLWLAVSAGFVFKASCSLP